MFDLVSNKSPALTSKRRAEGAVYEMLEASAGGRHVESELPALDFHTLGIDYGTTNPFHALIVAVGSDERLHVCREWRYRPPSTTES